MSSGTIVVAFVLLFLVIAFAAPKPRATRAQQSAPAAPQSAPTQGGFLLTQSPEQVAAKSAGCQTCHTATDSPTMHQTGTVHLGCTDCHGGNADIRVAAGVAPTSAEYEKAKREAHVLPRLFEEKKDSSANVQRPYAKWLHESREFIRFVNPGDLRVQDLTCGQAGCHVNESEHVRTSMMTHGAMLWGAALYNNGGYPLKNPRWGDAYDKDGNPVRLRSWPPPTAEETKNKGILPYLDPLERWEISQPGNVLRVFERGSRPKGEVGNPDLDEDPGKPELKLSTRGFGTQSRTDPVFLGLQKTRLFDPLLSYPGTNDQPGDYRQSGCSACHVIYANDRDPFHSASYAPYGNLGQTATADPTIPKGESGHPIKHQFTRAIPSSQCMVRHVHPGTNMVTTYYGYTWWDNEIDGEFMYPKEQRHPSAEFISKIEDRDPEGATIRGKWADVKFLQQVGSPEFNAKLDKTQFADFHSHGWIFRAVFKHDRHGNLLDENGNIIDWKDADKWKKAVQLKDIHLEKGMHCIDCHFEQDNHGNGKLYGETRNALEIDCINCHGTIQQYATSLRTTGPAAPPGGTPLETLRTPSGQRRFYWRDGKLFQRAMLDPKVEWEVVQVKDTITPGDPHYSEKARLAKTIQTDGKTWGAVPQDTSKLAHQNSRMTCFACHTSWTPTCFGCHLQMTSNERKPNLHFEGTLSRNWTSYNFQVLRDDAYFLGIDGTVTKHRIAPVRSSCAILVSSQNQQRNWLYYMQQTISAEGFSGQAFSTYVPHTVRAKETRTCTDCHVSSKGDNNAWLAQEYLLGTRFMNFIGPYAYVAAGDKGFYSVAVTEHSEPPAVIGSDFQKISYPENYKEFVDKEKRELHEGDRHAGTVLDLQARGEYVYAAMGKGGFRIFDVANVDVKDYSEKMTTAPVSPLGQRLYVPTKYAQAVATPTTLGVDPLRARFPENEEQPIHLIYGFLYVADKYEGLVLIGNPLSDKKHLPGVGTLLDGKPDNNFLRKALAFNPDGKLNGARRIAIIGTYAYVLADRGLEVVDLNNPLKPQLVAEIGAPDLVQPTGISQQFRYAFVTDKQGLKVLDVTDLAHPRIVPGALVPLEDARNVSAVRTYAYVAGGKQGLVIADIEQPEHPKLYKTVGGELNDVYDVKIGMTNGSQFAYVADGKNGLRVIQTFSPEDTPGFYGFSPPLNPKLVATYRTGGTAMAVSEGIDRDRAVDESGNQLAVFGRRGARPFTKQELDKLFLRDGKLWTVSDDPPGPPINPPTTRRTGSAAGGGK